MTNILASLVLGSVLLAGCGGGRDCADLCTEGQAGSCTSITGNCGSFCGALDDVEDSSGCASQRGAYEACLDASDNVCDVDCDAKESALSSCVGSYCLGHANDPSCVTLRGSF